MPSATFIPPTEVERNPQPSRPPSILSPHPQLEWPQSFFPTPNSLAMNKLQISLAALSEDQLRKMVLRVAAKDPYFCDVIAMELGDVELYTSDADDAAPTTTTNSVSGSSRKRSKRRTTRPRTLSNTFVHFPPAPISADSDQEECCYHSGHLETEDYEFLTGTPEGRTYRRVQTVFMWSCCEGDETSPGCINTPGHRNDPKPTKPDRRYLRSKPKARPTRHHRA